MAQFSCTQVDEAVLKRYLETTKVWGTIKGIVLHHTYSPRASEYKGLATISGIWRYHTQNKGWSDIGYHFLVGPDGSIWLGRPLARAGAHCPGANNTHIGVCIIGNFLEESLTEAAQKSATVLYRALCHRFKLDAGDMSLHKEWRDTSCPGKLNHNDIKGFCAEATPSAWEATFEGRQVKLVNIEGTTYMAARDAAKLFDLALEVDPEKHLVKFSLEGGGT